MTDRDNVTPIDGWPNKVREAQELEAASLAYLALLKLPFGTLRAHLHGTLARLRDYIAERTGAKPEVVQATYEARARS